mmetsp:Transcript_62566/g.116355  ORF Transcript_62566/g.116355 Transcript_62566/m.116355 type:complete len:195 (-) Transcript_62566:287-871(-)
MAQGPSVELPPQVVEEAGTKTKGHAEQYLPWWFRAGCFCYSLVGFLMMYRLAEVRCDCALYPWKVESFLLVLQGCLSYMHDAHFQGSSAFFKYADRTCATFLACCQPGKFCFCSMDAVQTSILLLAWGTGLACYGMGRRAHGLGRAKHYHAWHSLWHLMLPLGGALWMEYTTLELVSNGLASCSDAASAGEILL